MHRWTKLMGNWLRVKSWNIKILTHTNNLTTSSLVTIYSPEECMYELLNATEHTLLTLHSEWCIIATLDYSTQPTLVAFVSYWEHCIKLRTYLLDVCNRMYLLDVCNNYTWEMVILHNGAGHSNPNSPQGRDIRTRYLDNTTVHIVEDISNIFMCCLGNRLYRWLWMIALMQNHMRYISTYFSNHKFVQSSNLVLAMKLL